MRITTIIRAFGAFVLASIMVAVIAVYFSYETINRVQKERYLAGAVTTSTSDLANLTGDYLLFRHERVKLQWLAASGNLVEHLRSLEETSFLQTQSLPTLNRTYQKLARLFEQLISLESGEVAWVSSTSPSILNRRLTAQTLAASRDLQAAALTLADHEPTALSDASELGFRSMATLAGATLAILAATWLLIAARVGAPVQRLVSGSQVLASGDLAFRFDDPSKDELGDLAHAFNLMAEGLQSTTASRNELDREIADRRAAEAEIKSLNKELEARVAQRTAELTVLNKELEAFSYSVSHDLRAPLRTVDGFARALLEDYGDRLDADGRHFAERICAGTDRMAQLIDDLLKLSRISRIELTFATVDLGTLATTIMTDLSTRSPDRAVAFAMDGDLSAWGDKSLLRAALTNLLENAWKFTSANGAAKISFRRCQEMGPGIYAVSDNGAGFDMKYAGKLFSPFQRLHTSHEYEGTGIGLATVARIIHRHGGNVWAESAAGVGTTMFFSLGQKEGDT